MMAIQHTLLLQPWLLPTHAVSRRRLQTQVDAMVIWKSCLYDIVPIFFLYLLLTLFQQGPQDISAERELAEKAHMSRRGGWRMMYNLKMKPRKIPDFFQYGKSVL